LKTMKRFKQYAVIFAFALTLASCAAIAPVSVKIEKDLVKEAFDKAYEIGLTLGYELDNVDRDNRVIVFTKKSEQTEVFIRIELDKDKDPPEFKISGKDFSSALQSTVPLTGDMETIAGAMEKCCGITVKKKE